EVPPWSPMDPASIAVRTATRLPRRNEFSRSRLGSNLVVFEILELSLRPSLLHQFLETTPRRGFLVQPVRDALHLDFLNQLLDVDLDGGVADVVRQAF